MINTRDCFTLKAGERFVLHELNHGAKTLYRKDDVLNTGEHRSRFPGRHVGRDEILESREDISVSGRAGGVFKAKFVTGPDAGEEVSVHTNHVWPYCAYVGASESEARAEARRQEQALEQSQQVVPSRIYDKNAPKRATNVTVNSDLLDQAKRLGINLSHPLESRLAELVAEQVQQKWLEQNADAIEAYNRRVEQHGVFGDDVRKF